MRNVFATLAALLALLVPLALAQEVLETPVSPFDIVHLYGDLRAVEVQIPPGANAFSLSFGPLRGEAVLHSRLSMGRAAESERLRLLVGFPVNLAMDACESGRRTAVLQVTPLGPGHSPESALVTDRTTMCVPWPEDHVRQNWLVLQRDEALSLHEWTPLLLHVHQQGSVGESGQVVYETPTDENWLTLQVYFSEADSVQSPAERPMDELERLKEIDAVRSWSRRWAEGW